MNLENIIQSIEESSNIIVTLKELLEFCACYYWTDLSFAPIFNDISEIKDIDDYEPENGWDTLIFSSYDDNRGIIIGRSETPQKTVHDELDINETGLSHFKKYIKIQYNKECDLNTNILIDCFSINHIQALVV